MKEKTHKLIIKVINMRLRSKFETYNSWIIREIEENSLAIRKIIIEWLWWYQSSNGIKIISKISKLFH